LIKIDRSKILGTGSCGIVFEGTWNGKKVAVKRVQIANTESSKPEEEALQKLDHPNVIKLFDVQSDEDFR
jgi:serine/threonine-protein kinase/endoribonuclease IRE1